MLLRADFNVPLEDGAHHRRPAHPGRAADDRMAASSTARTSPPAPTSAGRRASRTRSTRWRRCASGWPSWRPGVELLENLRYDPGEEANDPAFVDRLVEGFDAYVNDAFGASHRAHASIVGPPQRLPSAAGRLLAKEVEVLLGLREHPGRPFVAVLGGAKVSDKLGVIDALLEMVDALVIGGGMCFTFLAAQGHARRRLAVRARPDRRVPPAAGAGQADPSPERRDARSGPDGDVRQLGTDLPDGWKGLDIGPGQRRRVRGRDPRRPHGLLERADGRVRGRPVRGRHSHGRASRRRHAGLHRRRRRRQRGRAGPVRHDRPASTGSRPAAARRSSCSSWATCPASPRCGGSTHERRAARKPLISGNWKMNLNHFEAIRAVQKLAVPVDERGLRRRRRVGPPAVHRPAVGPGDARRPEGDRDRARRAELPLGGQGRVHRRGQPGVPRQARRRAT